MAADRPGDPGELVRLYVEVRNFASVPQGGYFETRLSSRIEIRDGQGKTVWANDFDQEKKPLRTLSRLSDFYYLYCFVTPHLPAGTYQLVLLLADETIAGSRRVAQKSHEFRVTPLSARGR